MYLWEWAQTCLLWLLCGNAHQKTFSDETSFNNQDTVTWTDVCSLSLDTPELV